MSSEHTTIIRFDEQVATQKDGTIERIIGFVRAKELLTLFDDATLDANPRSAKTNAVTRDIIDSVREDPTTFQFKTKGILLGTSNYNKLERRRYQLNFLDPAYEGLLDGGHNMLALGIFILGHVVDERSVKKIKFWNDMKHLWQESRDQVREIRDELNFKVPVEILVPSEDDLDSIEEFKMALIDICAARNNNAQLTTQAKANQKGFYDEIRNRFPTEISSKVEWKTNQWEDQSDRPIKVKDIVALAWIPLTVLSENDLLPKQTENGPIDFSISPQSIYSGKEKLSVLFDKLMDHPEVTRPRNGPHHELHNVAISSAFTVLADLPKLHDYIFANLGDAYNKATGGRFGGIKAVRKPKKGKVSSKFQYYESDRQVPDGFVIPVLYGLKALMGVESNRVVWKQDPFSYLEQHLQDLAEQLRIFLDAFNFDPQKIGKNEGVYRSLVREVERSRRI